MKRAAKALAVLLCAALAAGPARAQSPEASSAPARGAAGPALIGVTPAVPLTPSEKRELERENLKKLRAGGGAAAGVGLGLMGYAIAAELGGPFGLAAGFLFFGAVTAYMAHRQLRGELGPNDLPLATPAAPAVSSGTAAAP